MAVDHHGGSGSHSDLKSKDPVRGTEDEERTGFKKTRGRVSTTKWRRPSGARVAIKRRRGGFYKWR